MIRPEEVYKIGMFNKPHGIGGELQFTFTDDIFDRVEADRQFINTPVYFPVKHAEEGEPGELSWDFFVGFRLEDTVYGHLGEVADVDTSTPNTLFVIDRGGNELLVPAREEFILDMDTKHRVITVRLPEGLLDLDDAEEC